MEILERAFLEVLAASELHDRHGWHEVMSDLDTRFQAASIVTSSSDEFDALTDAAKLLDDGESLAYLVYAFGVWRAKHRKI